MSLKELEGQRPWNKALQVDKGQWLLPNRASGLSHHTANGAAS